MGRYRGWQRPSLITGPSAKDAPWPATAPNGTEHRAVADLRATVGRQPWLAYTTDDGSAPAPGVDRRASRRLYPRRWRELAHTGGGW